MEHSDLVEACSRDVEDSCSRDLPALFNGVSKSAGIAIVRSCNTLGFHKRTSNVVRCPANESTLFGSINKNNSDFEK